MSMNIDSRVMALPCRLLRAASMIISTFVSLGLTYIYKRKEILTFCMVRHMLLHENADGSVMIISACVALGMAVVAHFHKEIKAFIVVKYIRYKVGFPRKPFSKHEPPPTPDLDYTQASSWAAKPGIHSEAEVVPAGETRIPQDQRLVDCFYVHPTSYFRGDYWNAPVPDEQANRQTRLWMLSGQGSAFNATCRIWAPHYRQACLASFFAETDDGRAALSFAYKDVQAAFLQFISEIGENAPYVLASHGQGGSHMVRLLEEHIDCSAAMCGRMVACYMVGSRTPLDKFTRSFKRLRECASPTDHAGVVIGWDTLADKAEILPVPSPGVWYSTGWEVTPEGSTMNTNPLTWTKTGVGGKLTDGYLGQMVFDTNLRRQVKVTEFLSSKPTDVRSVTEPRREDPRTTCESGFWAESRSDRLAVPDLDKTTLGPLGLTMLNGRYHCADFSLFYFNIRENVRVRVENYLKAK